jgi:hypothetical protein
MQFAAQFGCSAGLILALGGCGLTYSALPEVWDRFDPDAIYHMEVQVKHAIYCELKRAAIDARGLPWHDRLQYGTKVSTEADIPFPDNWGVQITLTLQADEKSALTPGLSLKTPLHNAPVNFRGETIGATGLLAAITYGPASIMQSYSLGLGGTLSSQNVRYDKYNFYYTARDLTEPFTEGSSCVTGVPHILGPKTTSSPFVDASNLGIHEWLLSAIRVIDYHRSSREATSGEGTPTGGATSDSSNYDNKFTIVSDATVSPTWNLVRIGTPTAPLFDANRTRLHELLMTVGPGTFKLEKAARGKQIVRAVLPSESARESHFASQIGSAVANAIRGQ